jgi:hypothetical protein
VLRFGLIAAAIAAGALYSLATATGNANVDAVERFHFAEYGFLALLYHRVWRDRSAAAALLLAFLAVFMVGTLDEGIQWFVPIRVGEWRDVLLNSSRDRLRPGVRRRAAATTRAISARPFAPARMAVMLGATSLVFAIFFYVVHVGHEVRDPAFGAFLSRYTASELLVNSADRARRWRTDPLTTLAALFEGGPVHVRRPVAHAGSERSGRRSGDAVEGEPDSRTVLQPVLDFPDVQHTQRRPVAAGTAQERRRDRRRRHAALGQQGKSLSDLCAREFLGAKVIIDRRSNGRARSRSEHRYPRIDGRMELLGIEPLEEHARRLAALLTAATRRRFHLSTRSHLSGLDNDLRNLRDVYLALSEDARQGEESSPAAEWLLDNFPVISASGRDIRHDLPAAFYHRLPRMQTDEFVGQPRIYAMASEARGP